MSLKPAVNENDHIQGAVNAPVELVEYGDYECSYCGRAYPVVKKLQAKLGDKLKFVFRNFPLDNLHPHALTAATAAEVACDMGKFWEMHDALYENQDQLNDEDIIEYARKIGLDVKEFEAKFSDMKYSNKIEADIESGLRSGVNGTPSFYINGVKYQGDPYSVSDFLEYIESL